MKQAAVLLLFFISAPILLAARVVQQLYLIESSTGFYRDGLGGIGTAITVMCFALAVAIYLLVWLSEPPLQAPPKKNAPLGVSACFAALCISISSVGGLMSKVGIDKFVGWLGIASATALALYGVRLCSGKKQTEALTFLPIIHSVAWLVLDFIQYTGEVTVTDSAFNVVTMTLIMLFFYTSGKFISGAAGKPTVVMLYTFGLCTAFFCIDSVFVRAILSVFHSSQSLHGNGELNIAFVGIAVYSVATVLTLALQNGAEPEA